MAFYDKIIERVVNGLTQNPANAGKIAFDFETQIVKNLKAMQCDACILDMSGGVDRGFKSGYGWFSIDRNKIIQFPGVPAAFVNFDKIMQGFGVNKDIGVNVHISALLKTIRIENSNGEVLSDSLISEAIQDVLLQSGKGDISEIKYFVEKNIDTNIA